MEMLMASGSKGGCERLSEERSRISLGGISDAKPKLRVHHLWVTGGDDGTQTYAETMSVYRTTKLQWRRKMPVEPRRDSSASKEEHVRVHSPHMRGTASVVSRAEYQYPQFTLSFVRVNITRHSL